MEHQPLEVRVKWSTAAGYVAVSRSDDGLEGVLIPHTIEVDVLGLDGLDVHFTTGATDDMRPVINQLVVTRNGAPVTTSALRRLNLTELLAAAVDKVSMPTRIEDGHLVASDRGGPSADELSSILRPPPKPPRNEITDELLEEVAEVYRNAPTAPTKAVWEHLNRTGRPVGRKTAGHYVREARAKKKLGTSPGRGKAGEAR